MKTAEQLREISANHKTISLAVIEYLCTEAAQNGSTSVMIFDRTISQADVDILKHLGIKVDLFIDAEGFHYELSWHI